MLWAYKWCREQGCPDPSRMGDEPWNLDSSQFAGWIAAYELDCDDEWRRAGVIASAAHNAGVLVAATHCGKDLSSLERKPKFFIPKYVTQEQRTQERRRSRGLRSAEAYHAAIRAVYLRGQPKPAQP